MSEPNTQRLADCKRAWQLKNKFDMTFAEVAYEMGLTKNGKPQRGKVQRMIATYEDYRVVDELRQRVEIAEARVIELEQHDNDLYDLSARDDNDFDAWVEYLHSVTDMPRMLRIQFWSDIHLPDVNMQAFSLALEVARVFQPDLNVFLGDEFDFDTLSTHWPRASNRKHHDAFKEVALYWNDIVDRVCAVTPTAVNVMIGGNHTKGRVENYVNQQAVALDETIIEAFINIVRSSNRVMWLGWTDEFWIGNLHVEHGTRTGENASKNSLKDVGWANPRVGGHVHFPSTYLNYNYVRTSNPAKPRRVWIQSITTPALCNTVPHYFPGMSKVERAKQEKKTRWANGVGIGFVNIAGEDCHLQNIVFHERADGSMVATFGEHELIQQAIQVGRSLGDVDSAIFSEQERRAG